MGMTAHEEILSFMSSLAIGSPAVFGGLALYPVATGAVTLFRCFTLGEALAAGQVNVREISTRRSDEMLVSNHGDTPVFLLDGEELVSSRQTGVLSLSLLAAAGTQMKVPVFAKLDTADTADTQPFLRNLPCPRAATGVAVAIGSTFVCAHIFASHSLLSRLWSTLVLRYARKALAQRPAKTAPGAPPSESGVRTALHLPPDASEISTCTSPGAGMNLCIRSAHATGKALVMDGTVVHLELLPIPRGRTSARSQ
jgi:hypothetical protein